MAAYAALVSLMHIIEKIQNHPCHPISLDKKVAESLCEKVAFLQDFLEAYSRGGSEEEEGLMGCIADTAYAAEDIIESHVVDQILGGSTSHGKESIDFYHGLQKIIVNMDFIKNKAMDIKNKMGIQDQLHRNSRPIVRSLSYTSTGQTTMVGFDDVLEEIMDKLTGQQSNDQIIPIVGMGGIGKTTLARNLYAHPLIVQHFDIRAWLTISQEYNMHELLLELNLLCQKYQTDQESREILSQKREEDLGERLYKCLCGWRYLIVMDDMWSLEVWHKVKFFFPDNNSERRIVITSRLASMAFQLTGSHGFEMRFPDEEKSWDLLCKKVFGEEGCPLELEEIGKKIARNCQGLPLSIVVIGGLLAKSKMTQEYWEYIAENLNAIVNSEDGERCLKMLQMSYNQLPIHLKPCFLYMGIFHEDSEIRVSGLIKLWVAEGFLKPVSGKNLEVIAEEYLKDLIERNLILIHKWGSNGGIKSCKIHDLLRDLCLREAQKQKFFYVKSHHNIDMPQGKNIQCRIGLHRSMPREYLRSVLHALQSASHAYSSLISDCVGVLSLINFRLLRLFKEVDKYGNLGYSLEEVFRFVNSRYLAVWGRDSICPSSVYLLWNLQTLIVKGAGSVIVPTEIWKMPQLRHVEFKLLYLPDPPNGCTDERDEFVLVNLQTLLNIANFKCSEDVVKRIPNIKKLKVVYEEFEGRSAYCLNNVGCLHKLESLACSFHPSMNQNWSDLSQNLTFPHSLKKLTLEGSRLHWEDITTKIGSLPLLEVLKLRFESFEGPKWETVEGQFCSLKFLLIDRCYDLEYWTTDSTHFPRLEHLALLGLLNLKEIPSVIGEIPTLQSIRLCFCSDSVVISAKKIQMEQEELGNNIQVQAVLWEQDKELESLASLNFQAKTWEE